MTCGLITNDPAPIRSRDQGRRAPAHLVEQQQPLLEAADERVLQLPLLLLLQRLPSLLTELRANLRMQAFGAPHTGEKKESIGV